jgi:argininosuccinate lyase
MAIETASLKKQVRGQTSIQASRNHRGSTDVRLWMRDEIDIVKSKVSLLQKALVKLADKYSDNIMPGYTHLQRAQPVSIGSFLLSFVERLERDYIRLKTASCL